MTLLCAGLSKFVGGGRKTRHVIYRGGGEGQDDMAGGSPFGFQGGKKRFERDLSRVTDMGREGPVSMTLTRS